MNRRAPEWPGDRPTRLARRLLHLLAGLVPRHRRGDWLEEWEGELWQLRRQGAEGAAGRLFLPGFLAGALWHGLWERKEGWKMDGVLQDLRYAGRTLARSPGFTVAAVLMLGASIGASTALYSVFEKALLADPPFPEPERVVVVDHLIGLTADDMAPSTWSYPRFAALRDEVASITTAAGYALRTMTLTELGEPAVIAVERSRRSCSRCWASPPGWAGSLDRRRRTPARAS